jgi:hypothetical protein
MKKELIDLRTQREVAQAALKKTIEELKLDTTL